MTPKKKKKTNADFDNTWKEALRLYFQAFLLFFFPTVHDIIDWNRQHISLESEMQQMTGESEAAKRITDKLFQVWLRSGEPAWILIHIEIQSQYEADFADRIYYYNCLAVGQYGRPVISVAILGDEIESWRPRNYQYTEAQGDYEMKMKFPIAKLVDYESRWEELEASTNPFAIMVMAHLKTKATQGLPQERLRWKRILARSLFEKGYSAEEIRRQFQLIDRMMALPKPIQRNFKTEMERYQEEKEMRFMSQIELMAMEDGIEEGKKQGFLEALRENALDILQKRFSEVPPELTSKLNSLSDASSLKELMLQAVDISSLAEFEQLLESDEEAN
ncbi:MAG: transposase [Oscillatoria sp. SIO1A7]|nr:transposase [Oscillatoria sp. SIO1A7]